MGRSRVGLSGDLESAHGTIPRPGGVLLRDDGESSGRMTWIHTRAVTLGIVKLLESARARVRAMDPKRFDIAVAALFVTAGVIELLLIDNGGQPRAPTTLVGAVALSAVAFRRSNPVLAALLFLVPAAIQSAAGGYFTSDTTTPFVAILLLLFSFARYAPGRRFQIAASVLGIGMAVTLFLEDAFEPGELFWAVFLFGLPVLAGRALRSRALLQAELREKAEREETEREWRAAYAVEEERERIATELQTLVANGLNAMVVQAEAVPRTIDSGDLVSATGALTAVEETGRDALIEMRRLLGVLRRGGEGAERTPQPGYRRIVALVEQIRERGLPVELRVEGERRHVSPGIDLTFYRVLEDALEAAAERGATSADILIRFTDDQLQLQVTDDREGGPSHRIPGLRDRVGLYGGHLSAGRLEDDSAFRLRARLPFEVMA